MTEVFIYLAIGAVIVGVATGADTGDAVAYAVTVVMWPFIAITVAASMAAEAFRRGH